ncbi:MAG: hypothetical protein H0T79_23350, partial [Deltaproteobacteria bacterium]|nr:hypothetical protein [Deltaproteobacteria bacterium]
MSTPRSLSCSLAIAGALVALVGASARAQADDAPKPVPHSIVVHVAPIVSEVGVPIELAAMIDAPFAETLSVRWRAIGAPGWQDVGFERSSAGGWYANLPAASPPGVEYYIRGQDANGAEVAHFASQDAPHVVRIDPTELDRLEALDRARVFEHANQVSFD